MKKHEFNFALLPKRNMLFGLNIDEFEVEGEKSEDWHPVWRIRIGFIFFTFSYINTVLDI